MKWHAFLALTIATSTGCCTVAPLGLGFLHGMSLIPNESYEAQIRSLEERCECGPGSGKSSGESRESSCRRGNS